VTDEHRKCASSHFGMRVLFLLLFDWCGAEPCGIVRIESPKFERGLCGPRFYLGWFLSSRGGREYLMKNNGMKIKHPKLRGEWAEMCFMTRAAEHGLSVTRPWGEMSRYDFAVEYKGHFSRVQVKSTMFLDRGGYVVSVRGWRGKYTGDPFDFVAAYLIPLDIWYILPGESFKMQGSVGLYPKLKKSKYGRYKEAWHLLRGGVVENIRGCEEEVGAVVSI